MKPLFTTLVCLLLITACGDNKSKKTTFSTDDYLHVIDLNKTAPEIKFSEVFASITPIVLETTKNSLIGYIDKIIATPEYIIVHDYSIANALFLFKKDGTFLHKFGRMGNGPGEYTNIADFCYDKATGTIYMLCFNDRINLYDIHTGSFLKSIKLQNNNGSGRKIYYQDGELYVVLGHFTNEGGYLLNRINQTTGKVEEAWFDFETHSKNVDYNFLDPFLFGDDKSFKFCNALMDGIILFEKGKITPFLTFPPEYIFTKDDFKALEPNAHIGHYLTKFHKLRGVSIYYERKDFIFLICMMPMPTKLIYDKGTKDFKYVGEYGQLGDDLMYKKYIRSRSDPTNKNEIKQTFSSFIASDDNGLYAVHSESQSPKNMRMLLEGDYISDYFKSAATKLANLEEDVNPFLFYYEFKD